MDNNDEKKTLIVDRILNGVVLDHMPAGTSLRVLRLLFTTSDLSLVQNMIAVAMNVRTSRSADKRKDVLKIADFEISEDHINKLGLIIPDASLNVIKNSEVVSKETILIPAQIRGIYCPAKNCITNGREDVKRSFKVQKMGGSIKIRCKFCQQSYSIDKLWESITKK